MRDDKPEVDWEALERRIVAAARFRLADRAARAGWRTPASRWARIAIPAGLAASLALAAGLAFGPGGSTSEDLVIEDVMAVAASEDLPADPLAVTDQAAFLATLLDPGE